MNRSILAREMDDAVGEGWAGFNRPGLERAFRKAARHSRVVRLLRVAVPALVMVGVVALGLATWFSPTRLLAKLPARGSLSSVGISGTKVTMALPRLEGYTRDARPYQMTAKTAAQDLLKPDNVELSEIRTKMETADKAVVEMTAATGLYHSKADQLILRESIVIKSTSGYEGHLSEAVGHGDLVEPAGLEYLPRDDLLLAGFEAPQELVDRTQALREAALQRLPLVGRQESGEPVGRVGLVTFQDAEAVLLDQKLLVGTAGALLPTSGAHPLQLV